MNSILELVLENAMLSPDKKAIAFEENEISYAELIKKAKQFASSLHSRGIKKGCRIAIESDDLISFFAAFFGCGLAGCVAVPIEKDISIYRLQEILKITKPELVFLKNNGECFEDFFVGEADKNNFRKFKSESVLSITSTTGTTGNPVLVTHTNRSTVATIQNLIDGTNLNADTVLFCNIPFNLAAGYRRVFAILCAGGTAVLTNKLLNEDLLTQIFENHNVNHMAIANSNINILINVKDDFVAQSLKKLDGVQTVSGSLTAVGIRAFHNRFSDVELYNVYGTTESGCVMVNKTSVNAEECCLGKPTVNAEIFLIDENGKEVSSPFEYGYVAIKGDMNMLGYYRKKALSEKVMKDDYILISDIAYFDEQGYFYFVSRVGDIIDIHGHKILPSEIETVSEDFKGVVDCACVGEEDDSGLQTPILYIQVENESDFDMEGLQKHLKNKLEKYKVPSKIKILKKIPRTATGKVLRKSLLVATKI